MYTGKTASYGGVDGRSRQPERAMEAATHPWLGWDMSATLTAPEEPDCEQMIRMKEQYLGAVAEADAALGRLVDNLKQTGEWERTLVILTSDQWVYARACSLAPSHACMSAG